MNEQTMLLEYKEALIQAKKELAEKYKLDVGLNPKQQTERLLEMEARLMAEKTIPIFKKWFLQMKAEIILELT